VSVVRVIGKGGGALDPFPFDQNGLAPPEADVGRRRIADALMVSQVFVVGDEGLDLSFEIARQVKFSSRIRLSSHFARSTYHASGAGYS
jgi:hypothetical protein